MKSNDSKSPLYSFGFKKDKVFDKRMKNNTNDKKEEDPLYKLNGTNDTQIIGSSFDIDTLSTEHMLLTKENEKDAYAKAFNPLGLEHDKFSVTFFSICRASIKYFVHGNYKYLKLLFLFVMVTIKNVCNMFYNYKMHNLDTTDKNEQKMGILFGSALAGITHTFNFILDWIFESHLCKYGGAMNILCLFKIFNSKDVKINDISPVNAGYCIEDGSKSMARVSKAILMDLPSKLVHLFCDSAMIFVNDKSAYKVTFLVFFGGAMGIAILKMYIINFSMKHVRPLTLVAAERDKLFQEMLDRSQIIKSYSCDTEYLTKFRKICKVWVRHRKNQKFSLYVGEYAYKALTIGYQITVCMVFIYLIQDTNTMTLTCLFKFLTDTVKTNEKISDLFKNVSESVAEAEMIMIYLHLTQEDPSRMYTFASNTFETIEFKNVSYDIKGTDKVENKRIFDNINLTLKNNEKVVLCGKNGSGKSSMFKILLNYVPFQGEVLIDGVSNIFVARRSLNNLITMVPQNTVLMDGTIFFNIQLFSSVTYEECIEICKELKIHEIIMRFPLGYNTQVGSEGKNLNGGLRQKIFYARAFLKKSPIYLFDEPSNNLDEAHTKQFMDYIFTNDRFKDKFVFVICHDKEYINMFDRKLFFENGEIVERNELLIE